jgi:TolB-like protein/Tfp pilus assembly protein PilF
LPTDTPAVFISYASQDVAAADAVVRALEQHKIACWIAPRDVTPGEFYADSIVRALNASRLLVVVLTENAVASPHVLREVERTSAKRHPIISIRIGAVALSPSLEYFLSASHWLDAGPSGIESALLKLVEAVQRLVAPAAAVGAGQSGDTAIPSVALFAHPTAAPAASQRLSRPVVALIAAIVVALAYILVDRFWLARHAASESTVVALLPGARPAVPAIPERSVAVLPFLDMSEKKDQEYFSDGLAEELIDMLTKVPGLRVPARTSSFYFKGKQSTLPDIARALKVAHLLEGSVRKSGNTLRITVQLIRADSGYHVWSESFDRTLNDVFKIQDEIAAAVVKALKVSLMAAALPQSALTTNAEAYALYLQARALGRSSGTGDYLAAIDELRRAVALDPTFAAAYSQMAQTLVADIGWHDDPQLKEPCARARAAADKALQLAPTLSASHLANGVVLQACGGNLITYEKELKRALELAPGDADVLRVNAFLAVELGHLDEAIEIAKAAIARDPLNPWNYFPLAQAQGFAGKFADAAASYRAAIEINATPPPAGLHALLANALLALHEPAEALKETERESDDQFRQMDLPLVYDALGRKADAERAIAVFEQKYSARDPLTMAEFYACRNDADHALPWLEHLSSNPGTEGDVPNRIACLKHIESDARYQALLLKWRRGPKD